MNGLLHRIASTVGRLAGCFQSDPRLLVRAMAWRVALPALKYLLPLPALVRMMGASPFSGVDPTHAHRQARLDAVRHLLAHGGRLVISDNCLERSLVLYRFLTEVGAQPQIVMGVDRVDSRVDGHVWIEMDGAVLADGTTHRYAPIVVYGGG